MEIPKKSILLVEDEAIIALMEKNQLEGAGYGVVHANSGEAAIEAVGTVEAEPRSCFDIVLMDIDLGRGMSGTEAARRILSTHDIPVLFLSSHTEPEIVRSTELITNYGYVVKSSSFTVLDASIKMALKLFEAQRRINRVNADFEAANEELRLSLERLQDSNRELALSNEKFNKIFQSNPDYVAISRLDDGTYLDVNEGFVEMMGYTREEVIGKSSVASNTAIWAEPADRRQFTDILMRDKKVSSFRTSLVRKDGSSFTATASARMLGIDSVPCLVAVVKDLSAEERAALALSEGEERFRLAMEATTDGLWDNDLGTGKIYYSPAYARMLGFEVEEIQGSAGGWLDFVHPEDRQGVIKANEDCIRDRREGFEVDLRMRMKTGGWKWVKSRGRVVSRDRNGRALRLIGTHTDITGGARDRQCRPPT